jgi:hypothetical protein
MPQDPIEQTVKEALDALREDEWPEEVWPMVVAAVVQARFHPS